MNKTEFGAAYMTLLGILNWASLLVYLTALALLWQYTTSAAHHSPQKRTQFIMVTLSALILHALELYLRLIDEQGANFSGDFYAVINQNFALGHTISIVALFATLAFILLSMLRASVNLGLAILPSSILALLAGRWLNPAHDAISINSASYEWHFVLGIICFALLSLSFAQSLLILAQEKQLKSLSNKKDSKKLIALPALQSMESLLFKLLWLGFIGLSGNLLFGAMVNLREHGTLFLFNHHIILSLLTWLAYAILLAGHHFWGWRGRQASIYTIICYSLFLLGYFGPRAVRELIIN